MANAPWAVPLATELFSGAAMMASGAAAPTSGVPTVVSKMTPVAGAARQAIAEICVAEQALAARHTLVSTGRSTPLNLTEQLAMQEVLTNPRGITPPRMPEMSDVKNGLFAADGWMKRQQTVNGVTVHFVENVRTGGMVDFKFTQIPK